MTLAICMVALNYTGANDPVDSKDPMIVRTTTAEDGVQVLLANLEKVTTTVELKSLDTKEVVLDEQVRNRNGFSYDLHLDKLAYGRYILSVTKGETVKTQVILVNENGIYLSQVK